MQKKTNKTYSKNHLLIHFHILRCGPLKGTVHPVFFYCQSDSNEKLWAQVKSKNNGGNFRIFLPVFFIEKNLFAENGKNGVRGK